MYFYSRNTIMLQIADKRIEIFDFKQKAEFEAAKPQVFSQFKKNIYYIRKASLNFIFNLIILL